MEAIKKLCHLLRVVYFMIRKGILSKKKLVLDLQLFLKRSKTATKALANLIKSTTNLGTSSMDPNIMSYYNSCEVEFSCSNTPSYTPILQKKRNHRRELFYNYESASDSESVMSPPVWSFGKNFPRMVRVTDSPFPIKEEEEVGDGSKVDKLADEFIKRFYEQLKIQQQVAMTPKYEFHR